MAVKASHLKLLALLALVMTAMTSTSHATQIWWNNTTTKWSSSSSGAFWTSSTGGTPTLSTYSTGTSWSSLASGDVVYANSSATTVNVGNGSKTAATLDFASTATLGVNLNNQGGNAPFYNLTLNGQTTATASITMEAGAGPVNIGSATANSGVNAVFANGGGSTAAQTNNIISQNSSSLLTFVNGVSAGGSTQPAWITVGGSGSGAVTFNGVISNATTGVSGGSAGMIFSNASTVNLNAANTYTGTNIFRSGNVQLGSSGTLGNVTNTFIMSGGVLDLGATTQTVGTISITNGTIQNGTIIGSSYDLQAATIAANLSGSGAITKTTSGKVNLTGANSAMTGAVGVSAGTLEFGAFLGSGAITVTGGSLQYDGTTNSPMNGGLTMSGGTILSLTGGGNGGIKSTGAVALGTASQTTTISLSGIYTAGTLASPNTYTLINTTGLNGALTTPGTLQFTGSTLGNNTIGANGTANVGRTQYVFTTTTGVDGSIVVAVSGGGVAINWNGGSAGTWNDGVTANTIWTKASDSSSTVFYNNDSPTFGSGVSPTVTVASGGVAPATTTFAGNGGDVVTITNAAVSSAAITNQTSVVNSGAGKAVFNASISGNGGVTNSGVGETDLNKANTYSGTTAISSGKIAVGSTGSLGSGAVTVSGGILDLGGTSATPSSITITGGTITNGSITSPTYTLNGGAVGATFGTGAITVGNSAKTIVSGSTTLASSVTIQSGATLALGANNILNTASYSSQPGTLDLNGYSQAFSVITGNGPIKTGAGTLTWSVAAAPSYAGAISIDANGTVAITNSYSETPLNSFTGSGTLSFQPVGALDSTVYNGIPNYITNTTSTKTSTFNNENSSFTGTSLFNNALVNINTGAINATTGIITGLGSSTIKNANGSGLNNIKITATNTAYEMDNPINTGSAIDQMKLSPKIGDTFTLAGLVSGSGTLSIGTGGTLVLANANNSFSGGFIMNKGVVKIANGGALGTGPFTWNISTDGTANGILSVTDNASLSQNIDLGWSSTSYFVGEINVATGKKLTMGGNILTATNAFYTPIALPSSGGAGLTKSGSGTLVLNGQNNYAGATTISAGVLAMNGTNTATAVSVSSGATLAGQNGSLGAVTISSGGTLNLDLVSGARSLLNVTSLSLGSTTTLDIEDVNASAGTGYDQININGGALTYNGLLNINSLSSLATLFGGASQSVVLFSGMVNPTTGTLTSVVFNQSGQLADPFTSSGTGAGVVWTDQSGNYTFTPSTGTLAVIMVPEPGTCAMVGLGLSALAVTIIRRRRND